MSLSGAAPAWHSWVRFVVILIAVLGFVGLMVDVFSGFPLAANESKSWGGYVVGLLSLGALYLLGEGVAGAIGDRDRVTDPLWKRVTHLLLLLAVVGVFGAIAYFIVRS